MSNPSILLDRAGLSQTVSDIAEVANYLWLNGWAERNGGNITVNITEFADEDMRRRPAISAVCPIGATLPYLKGQYFFCKGTGKRMRDLARHPMDNGAIIRILDDCASYVIIADHDVPPTSELPSHLAIHNRQLETGSGCKATLHTHPIELIALSHHRPFLEKDVLSKLLWSMIPETKAFCPLGLGIVRYALPGSNVMAAATLAELEEYDVVMWEKHGVFAKGHDIMEAFDQIDVLSKSAKIYVAARTMGFQPEGMSDAQMSELSRVFDLPR